MKIKITKKKLEEIIKESIKKKLSEKILKEGNDFTAKRHIIQSAQNASMTFESEIIKLLDLVPPDELPAQVQEQYHLIVEDMKKEFVDNVVRAVERLSRFPRNNRGE